MSKDIEIGVFDLFFWFGLFLVVIEESLGNFCGWFGGRFFNGFLLGLYLV